MSQSIVPVAVHSRPVLVALLAHTT